METIDFYNEIRQSVLTRADATMDFSEPAFAEVVTEHLLDGGAIHEFVPCAYRQRGMKVDGYTFIEEESTLDLFIVDYRGGEEPESMNKTEMEQAFRRVETFLGKALSPKFADELEVSHPAYGLVHQIREEISGIVRIRFILLTDAVLSERVKDLPSKKKEGREWAYRVWDMGRLGKVIGAGEPEEIVVDFEEMFGSPLRCLPAGVEGAGLQSYLAVIPGDWLAEIYDRFSGRLLEQNVRTFLQLKGAVNKGIRNTILNEPDYFFPYNNGISATAEHVECEEEDGAHYISSMRNFQIVNGGQTTASIYNAFKKDKGAPVEKVRVQMKLTVVEPENVGELVPKISKFANSQNKVSDADFFSNHPFHVRIEGTSRRIWAPPAIGSLIQTRWFYERARGQYANQQAYLSVAKRREFQLQNPRTQVITKTDLAKCMNTFRCLPHEVSRGAQKNFAKFAEFIGERWDADDSRFSEHWFKSAIAQCILFRACERIVQDADWYAQGYRANTVAYGIALLVDHLAVEGKAIDLVRIWNGQGVGEPLKTQLSMVCGKVQQRIIEAASLHGVSNVTEWCKRAACWEDIKKLQFPIRADLSTELLGKEDAWREARDGRKDQKMVNEAEAEIRVVEMGASHWEKVLGWAQLQQSISPNDMKTLSLGASIPKRLPNTRQAIRLLEIDAEFRTGN